MKPFLQIIRHNCVFGNALTGKVKITVTDRRITGNYVGFHEVSSLIHFYLSAKNESILPARVYISELPQRIKTNNGIGIFFPAVDVIRGE